MPSHGTIKSGCYKYSVYGFMVLHVLQFMSHVCSFILILQLPELPSRSLSFLFFWQKKQSSRVKSCCLFTLPMGSMSLLANFLVTTEQICFKAQKQYVFPQSQCGTKTQNNIGCTMLIDTTNEIQRICAFSDSQWLIYVKHMCVGKCSQLVL